VPHDEQKDRAPVLLDRKLVGAPAITRKSARRTLNQVTNGAPVVRRHIEQWQFVRWNGTPVAS
jgi:hypothetical protein